MTVYPQAILGMIEIDKASDELEIVTSAGTFNLVPTRNTYANVIDLMYELNTLLDTDGDLFLLRKSNYAPGTYDTDFVPAIELTTGTMTSITAGTIKAILFDSYTIDASRTVADVTPLYSWIPKYRSSDGNWFQTEADSVVNGSIGVSGNLSGIAYTPRQTIELEFPFVTKDNTFTGDATGDAEKRCFETVINQARAKSLQYSDSGNVYCKGVYYIYNISQYLGNGSLVTSWGDGYPNGDFYYVFCTPAPPNIQGQSEDRLNTYYNVNLTLTTGTAPAWTN